MLVRVLGSRSGIDVIVCRVDEHQHDGVGGREGNVQTSALHLSHMRWSRLLRVAVIGALFWAGYEYVWPAHGVSDVYVGRCDARTSVVVKASAYSHPLDFEQGDAIGYGMFLRVSDYPGDISVYNDAFSERDYPAGFPATYVGWNLAGERWAKDPGHYVGPVPTNEFAPVPLGLPSGQVRIFELPSGSYSRDATPPATNQPLLMNIFLPSDKIDAVRFNGLADCLASHQADINKALVSLRADFPYRSQYLYRPLRLGAIVRGLPPWSEGAYVDQIRSLYGDTQPVKPLPAAGLFTLYKGQSATGSIDGKHVRISILPSGETQWTIDGKILPDEPAANVVAAAGLPDVEADILNGLIIGHSICRSDKMDECAKTIEPHFWNNDGSTTFWMRLKAPGPIWVSAVADLGIYAKP